MSLPAITVFTTVSCSYCQAEKDYLTSRKLAFTEIVVDSDRAAADMIERTGQANVPVTLAISGDHEEQVVGFNPQRLDEILPR